jgi:hypothetical protein
MNIFIVFHCDYRYRKVKPLDQMDTSKEPIYLPSGYPAGEETMFCNQEGYTKYVHV